MKIAASRVLSVWFILLISAQSIAAVVPPKDGFFQGWRKSQRMLRFTERNLYDYINGGAELFLEFGLHDLLVQRYRKGDDEITLELYRMERPEAALGIYLLKCGDETPLKGIEARNSCDRYQFTVVKGDYFVQVNSFSGKDTLLPVMAALAAQGLETIPDADSVRLFDYLPSDDLVPGSELIVRGPFALQPIFTLGKGDILQLGGKVFGVVGDYVTGKDSVYTQIVIRYPNTEVAASAYENLLANLDTHLTVLHSVESGFTFRDFQERFGIVERASQIVCIKVNLPEEPVLRSEGN